MATDLDQIDREGELWTPLGKNILNLVKFSAYEALSECFEINVDAASTKATINYDGLLGQHCYVKMKDANSVVRYFNGIATAVHFDGNSPDLYGYRLVLKPWFWLLTKTSNCRIFKDKTVIDIVKLVFSDHGFDDFKFDVTKSYPHLEYTVQFNETDFDFVSRLLEEYGISYFFKHDDRKHVMNLVDTTSGFKPVAELPTVKYRPDISSGGYGRVQGFDEWGRHRFVVSGKSTVNTYNYTKAAADMLADYPNPRTHLNGGMELYKYAREYDEKPDGKSIAEAKLESVQSLDNRRSARGTAFSLYPGGSTNVGDLVPPSENQEYVVTRCSHSFSPQSYRSGGAGDASSYWGNFELAIKSVPLTPLHVTPRPSIAGVQSAIVVASKGKEGAEVDSDEDGRVFVKFYWDRDHTVSRSVRVMQPWAGDRHGFLITPRIGDEVIVQYEEGDPDRPIIIGSAYNSANHAAVWPDNTKTGILGRTLKTDGAYRKSNALYFDDDAGHERFTLRARKDFRVRVHNNEERRVTGSQTEEVDGSKTQTVGGDVKINVGGPKGGGNYSLKTEQTIKLETNFMLQLVVGESKITMTPVSITIESMMVNVHAKALMNLKSDGLEFINGGLVLIN